MATRAGVKRIGLKRLYALAHGVNGFKIFVAKIVIFHKQQVYVPYKIFFKTASGFNLRDWFSFKSLSTILQQWGYIATCPINQYQMNSLIMF